MDERGKVSNLVANQMTRLVRRTTNAELMTVITVRLNIFMLTQLRVMNYFSFFRIVIACQVA